ncbi:uncharacterized protein VTP21DRAFT_10068 [Calcarisporiella thermophila]|uniref:uncharacterized protein n=1 Tax=Calcarisporiella thermophila TaxID=911321 RepID=UPI00374496D1
MSDAYQVAGGALKLKGGGINKKKKKSKKEKEKIVDALSTGENSERERSGTPPSGITLEKTEAELKFEEMQKKRLRDKVQNLAKVSHKERVAEFNRKLEELTEHYDIPKVGPG